jgi:uncharacterized protein YprB with RNaseH-like and TPR domain
MQVPEQEYLDLVEQTNRLVFFDIEATGLRGDYNSVLVVSIKPYGKRPISFSVSQPGHDQKVVREAKDCLESFSCWCGYYSKGYDIPMLNTRLLRWKLPAIEKRPHIDLYYSLKANILTARRSQGHILSWLGTEQQKMTVSAEVWNKILSDPKMNMPEMVKRCESDCSGLEALYKRTRRVIREIKR